jgi:Na+/proline symporter
MVTGLLAIAVVVITLATFVVIGIRASRRDGDVEDWVAARDSQSPLTLGLSFLAAGMGAWVLFAPPAVGVDYGLIAVAGYALGCAAPFVIFGMMGRRIRSVLPAGHSLPEFLKVRFGTVFSRYVGVISVLYMLFFVTAELTAIAFTFSLLSDVSTVVTIIGVAVATLLYTTIGGLRASIRTDRFQGWMILALLGIAAVAIFGTDAVGAQGQGGALPSHDTATSLGFGVTLVIAVAAANMFHQGYWQRVWAARDVSALHRGVVIGSLTTIPVVAVLGFIGAHAAGRGLDVSVPATAFFSEIGGAPTWLLVPVLILALALVASSVDTLETALGSIFVAEQRGVSLTAARVITVALMVPAVLVALKGFDVLRLFLIADLLCTATVVPALSGLWRRATPAAAVTGAVAGLVGACVGAILEGGVALVTLPKGEALGPFLGALLGSSIVTVALSLLSKTSTDLEELGSQVPALTST